MISRIRGSVIALTDVSAVIEVGGVGFSLLASTPTLATLSVGSEAILQTVLIVRDDALNLYGFATTGERELFDRLLAVSGVGPKVALSLLTRFSSDELALAIAQGDASLIATAQGIGKKTAQRIIVELKGAFEQAIAPDESPAMAAGSTEVTEALLSMGFTAQEAALAVKGYDGDRTDSSALLRHALKRLGS